MSTPRSRPSRSPVLAAWLPLVVVLLLPACRTTGAKESAGAVETPAQRIAAQDAAIQDLRREVGRQEALLAERDAMIKRLEEWLLSQQRMLDDAMQEVVRTQAKQRSVESRAEAASELAEAEIALNALRDAAGGRSRPEVANAEQLLGRATAEFEKQNFGGALYLVRQAKGQIRIGELGLGEQLRAGEGEAETPFVVPLALTLIAKGNLREGPGLEFKILATLEAGTRITGYFTKGSWMRVDTDGGQGGWIHRTLVSPN